MLLSDKEHIILIVQLTKSNRLAFDQLFNLYSNRIYRFSRKLKLNHEEAEEVLQDTFLTLWERRTFLDPNKDFKAYLFKIAKSLIIKSFKRKALFFAYENYAKEEIVMQDSSTENLIHYYDLLEILEKEINRLPEARKEIFNLSRKDGLSTDEISQKLGVSRRTVENQIYRTLKLLKDRIQPNTFLLLFSSFFI